MKRFEKMLFLVTAACWLLFSLGFVFLLAAFFVDGSGTQLFGINLDYVLPVSSGTLLPGLVYVSGMVTASLICLAVSFGLLERALTMPDASEN